MEESVQVLAHDHSLSPLDGHLLLGQWSEEHEDDDGVDDSPVSDGHWNSCSGSRGEVVVSDEGRVGNDRESCGDGGASETSLRVIHPVNNSLVLLPLVVIHT